MLKIDFSVISNLQFCRHPAVVIVRACWLCALVVEWSPALQVESSHLHSLLFVWPSSLGTRASAGHSFCSVLCILTGCFKKNPKTKRYYLLSCSNHVLSSPPRNWNEGNSYWVVANLFEEATHTSHHFVKAFLAVRRLSQVHLVHAHYDLLDTQSVSQERMLSGLATSWHTGLILSFRSRDH